MFINPFVSYHKIEVFENNLWKLACIMFLEAASENFLVKNNTTWSL